MAMQPGGRLMKVVDVLRAIVDCSSVEDGGMDHDKDYRMIDQDTNDEKQTKTSTVMKSSEGKYVL
jgi:hypothetical protein